MRHRLKEPQIQAAVDAACERLQLAEGALQDCRRRVAQHRLALVDAIFDRGADADGLVTLMCVQLFGLCNAHHVGGGGEL